MSVNTVYSQGMEMLENLKNSIGEGIIKSDGKCYTMASRDLKLLCQMMYYLGAARAGVEVSDKERAMGKAFDGAMKEMFDIL